MIVFGLGNPGPKYSKSRHNVGFMAIEKLAAQEGLSLRKRCLHSYKWARKGSLTLVEPLTYMNNSGESVIQVMNYFKIDVDDLIVIYDDMDMPTGKLRLRQSGSAGGHNGMKSIIAHVGTQNFKRIRVGIDKHAYIPVVDYVLGRFTKEQQPLIEKGIQDAKEAVITILDKDFTAAMNAYN